MISQLPVLPILLPLFAGIITLFAQAGGLQLQRASNLLFSFLLLGLSVYSLTQVQHAQMVYLLGDWIAPYGIVLVMDKLSALMLVLTAILACAALCYAILQKTDEQGPHFHVLYQLQLLGLNGAFLTGDLFNLFVFFEVLLLASYGLLLHGRDRQRTRYGLHYVVINLIGSSLFLFAVGTLYGILGTLNMADMAHKLTILEADKHSIVAAASLLLLVVFGIKAAMFPLYLWMPGAYANTSAAVAALFAIMTKVGLYAIIRVHGTLFAEHSGPLANLHVDVILVLGMITLILAALGVFAARTLKEQTAFLVLASVATLLIGIGINTETALSASLYYLVHSTLIAAGLFLFADIISHAKGVHADKLKPGPKMLSALLLGCIFIVAAVAITGMPPLSGFIGKAYLLQAALQHDWSAWIFATILVSSLLLIIALARSGSILFYQIAPGEKARSQSFNKVTLLPALFLLACSPALVILGGPISTFTSETSQQLKQTNQYIEAVLNAKAVTKEDAR